MTKARVAFVLLLLLLLLLLSTTPLLPLLLLVLLLLLLLLPLVLGVGLASTQSTASMAAAQNRFAASRDWGMRGVSESR
jgi:hypothetical protein